MTLVNKIGAGNLANAVNNLMLLHFKISYFEDFGTMLAD
jgi:hypothetical protein